MNAKGSNFNAQQRNGVDMNADSQNGIKALYASKKQQRVFDATMFDRLDSMEDEIKDLKKQIAKLEKRQWERLGE